MEGDLVSKPYVELTALLMQEFGATISVAGYQRLVVPGGQSYLGRAYQIEPDASSASGTLIFLAF